MFQGGVEPKQKGAEPRARLWEREGSIPCLIAKCCSGYRTGTEVGMAPVQDHLIPARVFPPLQILFIKPLMTNITL